jgi:hypothetical protein
VFEGDATLTTINSSRDQEELSSAVFFVHVATERLNPSSAAFSMLSISHPTSRGNNNGTSSAEEQVNNAMSNTDARIDVSSDGSFMTSPLLYGEHTPDNNIHQNSFSGLERVSFTCTDADAKQI